MAGDWIKMRVDLATSPKVVRMASALRADRLRVIGGLHAVWCLFDVHSVDGCLDGYTLEALDELIAFPGFSAAMVAVGWLEDGIDSLCTPRFDEHNGQSAKRRAMETERKREARNASASDADKKRSREEKRREDISIPDGIETGAKRITPISCPADVDQQVWGDWLALRKSKKAAVTATVLASAKTEAAKAGMTLEAFLREWCIRGSQGLKAEWLKDKSTSARRPAAEDFGARSYGPGGAL